MSQQTAPRRRLGRGLSSMLSQPVAVEAPPAAASPAAVDADRARPGNAGPYPEADRPGERDRGQDPQPDPGQSRPGQTDVPRGTSPAQGGPDGDGADAAEPRVVRLPVDRIAPNRRQPRERFDDGSLRELAASIIEHGLMQPILVRPLTGAAGTPDPDSPRESGVREPSADTWARYELIAGERRWRAAQLAGLHHLPAIVHAVDDRQSAEWALIENLQREDLNPIERANALARLSQEFGLSHEQLADRVGLKRSSVTNLLRLLDLNQDCRELVLRDQLSMGHARCLLGCPTHAAQAELARRSIREGWSVRRLEREVRSAVEAGPAAASREGHNPNNGSASGSGQGPSSARSALYSDLERRIAEQLGLPVRLRAGRGKHRGTLSIEFRTIEQVESILTRLGVNLDD